MYTFGPAPEIRSQGKGTSGRVPRQGPANVSCADHAWMCCCGLVVSSGVRDGAPDPARLPSPECKVPWHLMRGYRAKAADRSCGAVSARATPADRKVTLHPANDRRTRPGRWQGFGIQGECKGRTARVASIWRRFIGCEGSKMEHNGVKNRAFLRGTVKFGSLTPKGRARGWHGWLLHPCGLRRPTIQWEGSTSSDRVATLNPHGYRNNPCHPGQDGGGTAGGLSC